MTQIPPYYPLNRNLDEVLTLTAAIGGTSPSVTAKITAVELL